MTSDDNFVRALEGLPDFTIGATSDSWWVSVEYEGAPYPIAVQLGQANDGRLICTGLRLGGEEVPGGTSGGPVEITARSLREIPLTRLLVAITGVLNAQQMKARVHPAASVTRTADLFEEKLMPYMRIPARPGPKGYPDEHFRQVADAYRRALIKHPRGTFKALADQLHASEATVRRWVQRAQDRGYLGASTPGKAGRQPTGERS